MGQAARGKLTDTQATALHEAAVVASGLDDFGTADYLDALGALLDAAGERSRPVLAAMVVRQLESRLASQAGWKQRPDCLARELTAPLVIVGIPRTGTTALHKVLSMDEQFQVLENWLIAAPMPRPPRHEWPSYPGYHAGAQIAAAMSDELKAAHFTEPHEADECVVLMAQSFVSNMFGSTLPLPDYDEWLLTQDTTPSFRRYADNLRLVGADDPDRTWLLKNPSHLLALDSLLEVFPDARIVHTHRDPAEAIPSVCSVLRIIRSTMLGDSVDLHAIGTRELSIWSTAARRACDIRERRPESFFDVDYRDLLAEPMGVVSAIYGNFGITLSAGAESAMRDWLRDNRQGKHGIHEYQAEDFGLDPTTIREAFAHEEGDDEDT